MTLRLSSIWADSRYSSRWADGRRYLNRAVQLAPYDMEIHRDLSVCLYQIGRREDADQHAKRSREIEADLVQLREAIDSEHDEASRSRTAARSGPYLPQEWR